MLETGKVLFKAFFDICRLVKRPQDIPASGNLLSVCLVVYGFCVAASVGFVAPMEKAIPVAVTEVLLIMAFTLVILQISGKSSRWLQTVTALSGTGIIISVIALPVYLLLGAGTSNQVNPDTVTATGLVFLTVLACWNLVIMAHIFRHALDSGFMSALVLVIAYAGLVLGFSSTIMPIEGS